MRSIESIRRRKRRSSRTRILVRSSKAKLHGATRFLFTLVERLQKNKTNKHRNKNERIHGIVRGP